MTELEYVLEIFAERLSKFKEKKLFLYGQGEYTRAIIERFAPEFRFAAVLSDTETSGEYCGVPVLSVDALAEEGPDVVILTEHKQTKEPDYERVHGVCEAEGVALYDMYGIDELAVHRELAAHTWQNLSGWERITEGYDVVSFAVPDTFMEWDGKPDGLLKIRPVFRRLAEKLTLRHVPILFVGRNALPRDVIVGALADGGVIKCPEDADTCLYMRRGEDLCFRSIRERFPGKRILHIGAGTANDGIIPRFYGIDTYRMEFSVPITVVPDKTLAPRAGVPASGDTIRREAVAAAIDRNQIVSFDVFDTLLMRKTLYPRDVFALTERRALARGIQVQGFALHRAEAEREVYCGRLEEIYDALGRRMSLPRETLVRLMELELETERSVITPRDAVTELYRYALEQGKRVILVSDMYMDETILGALLRENGVAGWEKLIISCEYGCFKTEGLFSHLKALARPGEGIVHIGDNYQSDICSAAAAGLETVHIPSALELAGNNGWSGAIDMAETLPERGLVGLSVAGAFADPFAVHRMKDMPDMRRYVRYGYIAAPVITGYLLWLADKLSGSEYDGVLFPARDGWLLHELYPRLREAAGPLPEGMYFYTSRHAAFLPVAEDEVDGNYIFQMMPELGHEQFMRNVFGMEEAELRPPAEGESRRAYAHRYEERLRETAAKQRAAQLRYFENCGLKSNGRYVMTDFISQGTTQSFIKRYAFFDIYGLCFGRPAYAVDTPEDIEYYCQSEDTVFTRNFMEMEGIMSSPEPSVTMFSEDGTPVFAEEARPEGQLGHMEMAQSVVREYVNEFFDLFYFRGDVIRPAVPEEIYGADGYHWVFEWLYDDWLQALITG